MKIDLDTVNYFIDRFKSIPDNAVDPFVYLDAGEKKLFCRGSGVDIAIEFGYTEDQLSFVARDWIPTLNLPNSEYRNYIVYLPENGSEFAKLRNLTSSIGFNSSDITEDKKMKGKLWSGDTSMQRWCNFLENVKNEYFCSR